MNKEIYNNVQIRRHVLLQHLVFKGKFMGNSRQPWKIRYSQFWGLASWIARKPKTILFSKIGSQRVSVEALSDWKLSREVEYARWAFELSKREIRGSS